MKKIDLGQTISILANLGVIAGIVFLGFEISQNNAQLASQTRTNVYAMRTQMERDVMNNVGGWADILSRVNQGEVLSEPEILRLQVRMGYIINGLEFMFLEDPESALRSVQWMALIVAATPDTLGFWTRRRGDYDPAFTQFFEERVLPRVEDYR